MPTDPTSDPIVYTRLRVVLDAGQPPWMVPVDYYRLLRAAVYNLLRSVDTNLADFLHTSGFSAEAPATDLRSSRDLTAATTGPAAEAFKLFCFSSLVGDGRLQQGRLAFDRPVVWFFTTPLRIIAQGLASALRQAGTLRLGSVNLKVTDLRALDEPAVDKPLTCVLLSPLVISATLPATPPGREPEDSLDAAAADSQPPRPAGRKRRYLTRDDGIVVTEARLRSNLLAKHHALHGLEPDDPEFKLLWATSSTLWPTPDRPTRLIRLSGPHEPPVRVRGSLGAVTMAGSPALLRLALHAGLGQYNASGMGFLLPESESHLLQIRDDPARTSTPPADTV